MVPLRFVSEALDAKVEWNADTGNIVITQNLASSNSSTNSNIHGTTEKTTNVPNSNKDEGAITYNQALNKALAFNYKIKSAEKEIYRTDLRDSPYQME